MKGNVEGMRTRVAEGHLKRTLSGTHSIEYADIGWLCNHVSEVGMALVGLRSVSLLAGDAWLSWGSSGLGLT